MVLDWYEITLNAFQGVWQGFLEYVPNIIGALVIFIIGWFIAVAVGRLVVKILEKIKFNEFLEKAGWRDALEKAEIKFDAGGFVGAVSKWMIVIVFLLISVEILGLVQFANFLTNVLAYLPNVVVAILIFVVTVLVADISQKLARAAVEKSKIGYSHIVGMIVRWSIWVFAILAILLQLKIAPEMIYTLFTGFVAMIVIAAGLAFGLGGKEVAGEILRDASRKLKGE